MKQRAAIPMCDCVIPELHEPAEQLPLKWMGMLTDSFLKVL